MIIVRNKITHLVIFMESDSSVVYFRDGILDINGGPVLDISSGEYEILTGIDEYTGFKSKKLTYDGAWSVDSYKAKAKEKIESDRDAIIFDEDVVVDIDGVNFQCGPRSLHNIHQRITLFTAIGGAPEGYEQRDENNVNHPATLEMLVSIVLARADQLNQAWLDSWAKKDALEEAVTLAQIDLIIG